jgi:hypothetical protein
VSSLLGLGLLSSRLAMYPFMSSRKLAVHSPAVKAHTTLISSIMFAMSVYVLLVLVPLLCPSATYL